MAQITVDSAAMREKASNFKNIAGDIKGYFDDMQHEIDSMKSVWTGEAAEKTVHTFESYRQAFEEKYTTIMQYSSFLEGAADAYDENENSIANAN